MDIKNKEQLKNWINKNLLVKKEVIEAYDINASLFDVLVARGKLIPFLRKGRMNLYLKSEVEKVFKEYMR